MLWGPTSKYILFLLKQEDFLGIIFVLADNLRQHQQGQTSEQLAVIDLSKISCGGLGWEVLTQVTK